MFDAAKAVEAARKKLTRQQQILKETLDQIDYITKVKPEGHSLIKALRDKRDRQAKAVEATEQLIEIYEPQLIKETKKR